MNYYFAQLVNAEMYSKILFFNKKVLNKFDDYFVTLKVKMEQHQAGVNIWPS